MQKQTYMDFFNPTKTWSMVAQAIDETTACAEYWGDFWKRTIFLLDTFRRRGDQAIAHEKAGQPPTFIFDYELITSGATIKPETKTNFDLIKFTDFKGKPFTEDPSKRPIAIFDPRAGHGPGIGGSKKDSTVGLALRMGHPVYAVTFGPKPCYGQTHEDVMAAQLAFLETIKELHGKKPICIGNCQAGWALALLAAQTRKDCPMAAMLPNGSPFSCFAGKKGKDPLRYKGGLCGGLFWASLLSDMGGGFFDGANLVMNFEDLNPANTFWTKLFRLWSKGPNEEERFLDFEKWWNSYFFITREEITFIVQNLFMGNQLETGNLELNGKPIRMQDIRIPTMSFASNGDNITPPQQAFAWIPKLYPTDKALLEAEQVIVYSLHESIGHLGIFVSGKIANGHHRFALESAEKLLTLPPGLYEFIVEDGKGTFIRRSIQDLRTLLGPIDEEGFDKVQTMSNYWNAIYEMTAGPIIRACVTKTGAELFQKTHPLRLSIQGLSSQNPLMWTIQLLAEMIPRDSLQKERPDCLSLHIETVFAEWVKTSLDLFRDVRDATHEHLFQLTYA